MPGQSPQRRMVDINVFETSGVDHPAHGREGWLVMKSAGAGRASRLESIITKGTAMPTTKEDLKKEIGASKLPEEQRTFLLKAVDLEEDVEAAAKLWQSLRAKSEADDPETPTVEAQVTTAPAPVAADATPALGADIFKSVSDPTERAALAKAAEENPALYKAFAAMEKQAAEALEKAAREEATRLDTEAVAKSRAELSHLAIDHDDVAKAMRRLELVDPANAAVVAKAFSTVEGQLEAAGMFKELGTSTANPGGQPTAMQKAETLAKSYIEAGVVKTHAEGVAKAFSDNPELYAAHEQEGTR